MDCYNKETSKLHSQLGMGQPPWGKWPTLCTKPHPSSFEISRKTQLQPPSLCCPCLCSISPSPCPIPQMAPFRNGAASDTKPPEPHMSPTPWEDKQNVRSTLYLFSHSKSGDWGFPSNFNFPFLGLTFLNTPKWRFYEQTKLYIKHFYIPKLTKWFNFGKGT